jgi:hypothetical protein
VTAQSPIPAVSWGAEDVNVRQTVTALVAALAVLMVTAATARAQTPTPPVDAYEVAYKDALRILRGVPPNECTARAPEGTVCVERYSDVAARRSAERGIARFSVTFVNAPGSYVAFMGRTAAGGWDYWFGAQDQGSQLVELPGTLLACTGVGGAAAQIQVPGQATSVEVEPLTRLMADAFMLTVPGTPGTGAMLQRPGSGWYRVSTPATGWIPERDVTDAANKTCAVHDAQYRVG